MNAISLFSGVEGFGIGFERAGIETVLQAEQDPWCLEVLGRHWPGTERVTDVRDVGEGWASGIRVGAVGATGCRSDAERLRPQGREPGDRIDLVYGGFPCQDLSVAGKRAGLGGERSGLWFEFWRVLSELRPRWAVIENVAGLLSSNEGRDFAIILDGLDELGFDVAWAVLDAQHFGVPQRRRRVFIVAGPRGRGAEQVLSLCESCGGNPETGRAAGADVTNALDVRAGGADDNEAQGGFLVADTVRSHPRPGSNSLGALAIPIQDAREVAKDQNGLGIGNAGDPMFTLDGASRHAVAGAGVRRLTPREAERLMGWPDDWTRWTADGREISDSHRYRMCGNGVVAPVAEWIGHRLVAVDALMRAAS